MKLIPLLAPPLALALVIPQIPENLHTSLAAGMPLLSGAENLVQGRAHHPLAPRSLR